MGVQAMGERTMNSRTRGTTTHGKGVNLGPLEEDTERERQREDSMLAYTWGAALN